MAWRKDSKEQSHAFAEALHRAGVEAEVVPARFKTHNLLNQDIGKPDDAPTAAIEKFLASHGGNVAAK